MVTGDSVDTGSVVTPPVEEVEQVISDTSEHEEPVATDQIQGTTKADHTVHEAVELTAEPPYTDEINETLQVHA